MTDKSNQERRFLLGNEAIARGIIEAGCSIAAAYPGTPSSEVLESLVKWKKELDHPIYLEWSINEKVAFEVAYGASLAGARGVAVMKMVGLNVASDPYLSAAYLGTRGGLVVVVADDPGPHSSQTEQDSRFFAWFSKTPVFDPSTPEEGRIMAQKAFELSEKYGVPVLLRPCLRVCHARQSVGLGKVGPVKHVGEFEKNWTRWAATPKFRFKLHAELNEKLKQISLNEQDATPQLIAGPGSAKYSIITSGSVSSHVFDVIGSGERFSEINIYKVNLPFPANTEKLNDIVDSSEKTLFIEETYPVLELQVTDRRKVFGRLSDTVPSQGELTPEIVEDLITGLVDVPKAERIQPDIKPRRPSLCPGCPHRPAFYLSRKVFQDAVYTGDIGCYTLGVNMAAVDTCLCMGASVGMAGGFSRVKTDGSDQRVVATIGDSTFYHSGVPALINAVHTNAPFVLIIMDNNITAMTGGQPTPAVDKLADGAKGTAVDMEKLARGCGVSFVEVVDPYDYENLETTLEKANAFTFTERKGVSVVITRRPCVRMADSPILETRYTVNESCDLCMGCVKDLECPAFEYVKGEKRMRINIDLCAGCGVCVHTCPTSAVQAIE